MVALRHGPWIYVSDHSFTSVVPALRPRPQIYVSGSRFTSQTPDLPSVAPAYSCGPGFTSMALVLTATGRRSWLWWPQGLRFEAPRTVHNCLGESRCLRVWFGVSRSLLLTETVPLGMLVWANPERQHRLGPVSACPRPRSASFTAAAPQGPRCP